MAVFTNLAVDCANDKDVAIRLAEVYSKLILTTREFGKVSCDVEHIKPNRHWRQPDIFSEDAGDWHTVCVSPNNIGNGLPLSEPLMDELRPQLYAPLKQSFSFRSAWFGWEAQDVLGEMDWVQLLDGIKKTGAIPEMPGLVLYQNLVSIPNSKLSPFCNGFLWYEFQ